MKQTVFPVWAVIRLNVSKLNCISVYENMLLPKQQQVQTNTNGDEIWIFVASVESTSVLLIPVAFKETQLCLRGHIMHVCVCL